MVFHRKNHFNFVFVCGGFNFIYLFVTVVLAHVSKKSCKLQWKIFNSNLEMEEPSNSGMLLEYHLHILVIGFLCYFVKVILCLSR